MSLKEAPVNYLPLSFAQTTSEILGDPQILVFLQAWSRAHTCRMFLGRREPTSLRRRQNDQNTLKFDQKHHFYATILARRRQIGPRRRQTLKYEEPRSPDPGVSTGMPLCTPMYM